MTGAPDGLRPPAPADAAPRVVALGGGHGLAATLEALTMLTPHVTAVVTVADDGGSSGRLRVEHGALPPGDLRMALATLAAEDDDARLWADALQHRLHPGRQGPGDGNDPGDGASGGLGGHALGNLLLHGLTEMLDDPVAALDCVARLVRARGRVLPMAAVPLDIVAVVASPDGQTASAGRDDQVASDGQVAPEGRLTREVRGQVAAATARGVTSVRLEPADPPVPPAVVRAVADADVVVLGPGSWFTSVLPHLLVPDLRRALETTSARVVVVLNLAPQPGETQDVTPGGHLDLLTEHAPGLPVSDVIVDTATPRATLDPACGRLGARLTVADVALGDGTARHDPHLLAAVLAQVLRTDREVAAVPAARGAGQQDADTPGHHAGVAERGRSGRTDGAQGGSRTWP